MISTALLISKHNFFIVAFAIRSGVEKKLVCAVYKCVRVESVLCEVVVHGRSRS